LKDNAELWEASQNIRTARNEYVHSGVARIGSDIVTPSRAGTLLQKAREILDWIEAQLPAERRRPRYEVQHEYEFMRLLISSAQPEGDVRPLDEQDET
jgi:hypothetical protein